MALLPTQTYWCLHADIVPCSSGWHRQLWSCVHFICCPFLWCICSALRSEFIIIIWDLRVMTQILSVIPIVPVMIVIKNLFTIIWTQTTIRWVACHGNVNSCIEIILPVCKLQWILSCMVDGTASYQRRRSNYWGVLINSSEYTAIRSVPDMVVQHVYI